MCELECVGWQDSARKNVTSKTTIQASKVFCRHFLNKIICRRKAKIKQGKC